MLITEHFNPKYALPLTLQFSRLAIYLWDRPLPTNFLNLSDSQKTWKQRQDALEQESDTDDGADDWHEFSGVRTDYGRLSSNAFPMERCIASTFVNRAKRAFRAGQSWQQFENSELAIDSEGLRLDGIPDVLDPRRSVGQDLVADAMLVCVLDADLVDVCDLADVSFDVRRKEPSPPAGLLLETGEREGFLQGDLSEHSGCLGE